ncbi:uncharacterized protein BDV17DRAFT_258523 [Aspergillus undulatus]|uniref:uncharacterized protein n=1 Tax=Aspergillus undulatus TaxID=1810928 RepID=UPI003CCCBA1C
MPCLRHLAHLHLLSEVTLHGPDVDYLLALASPALKLDHILPLFYFANLRTLSRFDLNTEGPPFFSHSTTTKYVESSICCSC